MRGWGSWTAEPPGCAIACKLYRRKRPGNIVPSVSVSSLYCICTSDSELRRYVLKVLIREFITPLLEEAYLPISQKAAINKPLIKKRGLDTADRKNYRPVSNLTFVFKLVERLISLQLTAFLEASDALPVTQSAYWKFHTTESALLKVYSDLRRRV